MSKLYYEAPSDEVFEEVKEKAMKFWVDRYPEATSPYYAQEKVNRIKDWKNIGDNVMSIVGMFDIQNQALLSHRLSAEANLAIHERMVDGGTPPEYNVF